MSGTANFYALAGEPLAIMMPRLTLKSSSSVS